MSNVKVDQMRVVHIHSYGGREQLELNNTAIPELAEGDVLVKIHAAAVNPVDWKIREGGLAEVLPHKFPLTLGWDFSGEIVSLGENVEQWKVGDAVYSRPNIARNGAYAEYIAVSANEIAAKPKSLSWQKSAAVPLVTLTAWQSLYELAKIEEGDRVLIHAGAGGVGIAAIQLAKQVGAYVYTTASSRNIDFLKSLGADEVIDYTQDNFTRLSDLDVVFDTMGGEIQEKSFSTLKKGGCMVSIVQAPDEKLAKEHGVRGEFCFVQPSSEQLSKIANLIDEGQLKVEVDSVYRLDEIVKAHEQSEAGHTRGKIVIQVSESE